MQCKSEGASKLHPQPQSDCEGWRRRTHQHDQQQTTRQNIEAEGNVGLALPAQSHLQAEQEEQFGAEPVLEHGTIRLRQPLPESPLTTEAGQAILRVQGADGRSALESRQYYLVYRSLACDRQRRLTASRNRLLRQGGNEATTTNEYLFTSI